MSVKKTVDRLIPTRRVVFISETARQPAFAKRHKRTTGVHQVARLARSGGRAGNTRRDTGRAIEQMPWRIPVNTDRPTEPLNEDGVQAIHQGAMRILEELGVEFLAH